jgi:hypothetical protein
MPPNLLFSEYFPYSPVLSRHAAMFSEPLSNTSEQLSNTSELLIAGYSVP